MCSATVKKPNTTHQLKYLMPSVKHSGGGGMIRACFVDTGSGNLAVAMPTVT